MISLATDDNNDLYLGRDGSLAVATGIDAVLHVCAAAAQALRGEMPFNADEGIPYREVVWTGSPNAMQFEAALRARLRRVEGVEDIAALSIVRLGDTLGYVAEIRTIYGVGTVHV